MTSDSKLFPPRPTWEATGYMPDEYGRWIKVDRTLDYAPDEVGWIRLAADGWAHEDYIKEIALPLYEGRMIGQFDFSQKGWVSSKGRGSVWHEISFDKKVIEPQFAISRETFCAKGFHPEWKVGQMRVTSATNTRTLISTFLFDVPCGDKVATLRPTNFEQTTALPTITQVATLNHI